MPNRGLRVKRLRFMAMMSLAFAVVLFIVWRAGILPPQKEEVVRSPVNLGLSMDPSSALVIVALDRGFFAQEGLRVNVTEYPSGKRALSEGLLTGKEDLSSAVELPVTISIMEGKDIRILAGIFNADNVNRVIARRSAGISRPEDLRGKRVATQRGSAVHFFLDLFLADHGISEADVEMSFLKAEELPDALVMGRVDAISMREPFISEAHKRLGDDAVVFAEPGLYPQTEVVVARPDWIERHPKAARAFVRALLRAEAFAVENPKEVLAITAKRLGVDTETVEPLRPRLDLHIFLDMRLVTLMQTEARWAIASKLTRATALPSFGKYIYTKPLQKEKPEAVTLVQ